MADILCGYTADRDETLVAYLYDDLDDVQRLAFDAHIATCDRCRHELEELRGVRGRLREWTTPSSVKALAAMPPWSPAASSARAGAWSALREMPAWAQVAAAVLMIGVSARVANLDIRYDRGGLTVHTGLSRPTAQTQVSGPPAGTPVQRASTTTAPVTAPWRADLDALERRLRTELRPSATAPTLAASDDRNLAVANADAQLLRKVRSLVEDSERRQRNELALGLAGVVQEFNAKRGTDLARIGYLNTQQNATGIEVVRQQGWIDYLKTASLQK